MNPYDRGDATWAQCTFRDGRTAEPFDPPVVRLTVRTPSGKETTYTYGGANPDDALFEHVADSGFYQYPVTRDASGIWQDRWSCDGGDSGSDVRAGVAIVKFSVEKDNFATV